MQTYHAEWMKAGMRYNSVVILPANPIQHGWYSFVGKKVPYFANRSYDQKFVLPCYNNPAGLIHIAVGQTEDLVATISSQLQTKLTLLENSIDQNVQSAGLPAVPAAGVLPKNALESYTAVETNLSIVITSMLGMIFEKGWQP